MFDGMNNVDFDSNVVGNNNFVENDMNVDINMVNNDNNMMQGGMMQGAMNPIGEPVQTKFVHRTIMHEVPHVCPIHTKIINHHVYKHTYTPRYTCSEENTISNVQCGSCCNFR